MENQRLYVRGAARHPSRTMFTRVGVTFSSSYAINGACATAELSSNLPVRPEEEYKKLNTYFIRSLVIKNVIIKI